MAEVTSPRSWLFAVPRWRCLAIGSTLAAGCSFTPLRATGDGSTGGSDTGTGIADGPPDGLTIVDGRPIDGPPDAPPDARPIDAPRSDWWNPAWPWRIKITVLDAAATAMPLGFQVGVAFDLDAVPCTGNRNAVRIVYGPNGGTTELTRVIDELGATNEWTWFRLPAAITPGASDDFWLYCGNPAAGAPPADPTVVFDLYDDFAGTSVSAQWQTRGAPTVSGGVVTLQAANAGLYSNATFGARTAVDFVMQPSAGAIAAPQFWGGFEQQFRFSAPWMIWYARVANQIAPSVAEGAVPWGGTAKPLTTAAQLYGVENYGTSAAFRLQDSIVDSHTYAMPIGTALNVRLHNFGGFGASGPISFDMVRARQAINPLPTVTFGAPEPY